MAAGSTPVASKHSIAAPFFLVKSTVAYFSKAYAARFCTGGVRLFALSCERRKKFFTLDLLPGQSSKQEVICVERKRDSRAAHRISRNLL